jgi:hypothetical protein
MPIHFVILTSTLSHHKVTYLRNIKLLINLPTCILFFSLNCIFGHLSYTDSPSRIKKNQIDNIHESEIVCPFLNSTLQLTQLDISIAKDIRIQIHG